MTDTPDPQPTREALKLVRNLRKGTPIRRSPTFIRTIEYDLSSADAAREIDRFAAAVTKGRRAALSVIEAARKVTMEYGYGNPSLWRAIVDLGNILIEYDRALADAPLPETGLMAPSPEPAPGSQ